VVDHAAGVSVRDASPNLFQVPLLRVEICLDGLSEKVGAVAVERVSQFVESRYLVRSQTEADGLFLRNP
jgi:hypothetical protein